MNKMATNGEDFITVLLSGLVAFAASVARSIRKNINMEHAIKQAFVAFFLGGAVASLIQHFAPDLPAFTIGGISALVGIASDVVVVGVDRIADAIFDRVAENIDPKDTENDNHKNPEEK